MTKRLDSTFPPSGRTVLVAAHPDDEVLWFSSVLRTVEATVLCYNAGDCDGARSSRQAQVLAAYPLGNVKTLGLSEAGVFNRAEWPAPDTDPAGLLIPRAGPPRARYEQNFNGLIDRLDGILSGCGSVFTHNPWGEYGHEEHVQVHVAVTRLQERYGFDVWYPAYFSAKTRLLMSRYIPFVESWYSIPVDQTLYRHLAALYRQHHCWTWYDDQQPLEKETWFRARRDTGYDGTERPAIPCNEVRADVSFLTDPARNADMEIGYLDLPVKTRGFRIRPAGEMFEVRGGRDGRAARFNVTAVAILDRCDGSRSVLDIIRELAGVFHRREAQITADILCVLDVCRRERYLRIDRRGPGAGAEGGRKT
jgi:LmbE family N-acetylglucosaminyl deacetylase